MDFLFRLFDFRRISRPAAPGERAFVGYGPVNRWWRQNMRTMTALHVKHNVAAVHIEWFGWASAGIYDKPEDAYDAWKRLAFWCRRRNLLLFVSVTNDNKGSGKYGDDNRKLAAFRPQITKVMNWIADEAWDGLYIQPVGETQTPAGTQIEAEAANLFRSTPARLVRNTGSRPTSGGGWAPFFAYHAAKVTDRVPSTAWSVTDHSTILNQLGGLYAQTYDPDVVEGYARKMLAQGSPCIVYGFAHEKPDAGTLKALGRAAS